MNGTQSIGLAALLAGLAALAAGGGVYGCSSSAAPSSTAPPPAVDSGQPPEPVVDAGPPVGAACASDTDCPPGDKCSNDEYASGNPVYPSPVCLADCTSSSTSSLAACGTNTLPGGGLCQPPPPSDPTGAGLCLPFCVVTPSGQVTGCLANDVCEMLGAIPDPDNASQLDGAGWCQPGCTADSQCPSGSKCDPLGAICVKTIFAATAPIGAICSLTSATTPCNCIGARDQTTGYCTATCVTGGPACPVPPVDGGTPAGDGGAGTPPSTVPWVCTAQLNVTATDADGGAIFTTQPPGLYGLCTPPCSTNADCASIQGHCSQGDPAAPAGFTGTCASGP